MTFLDPAYLLLLGLLAVVLLPFVLKPPRRVLEVSSIALWRGAGEETEVRPLLRRLRRNWLVILQALIVGLLVLSLARPALLRRDPPGRDLIFLFDASASMTAVEADRSRFDLARDQALTQLSKLPATDRVRLMVAGPRFETVGDAGSDRELARRLIGDLSPSHAAVDMTAAVAELLATGDRRPDEIFLFTDGAPVGPVEIAGHGVRLFQVGRSDDNVAVSRLVARPDPESPFRHHVLVEVSSFASHDHQVPLTVEVDDETLLRESFDLGPGERRTFVVTTEGLDEAVVRAQIDVDDALEVDNRAVALLGAGRARSVLLVTAGNYYLRRALEVDPLCELTVMRPDDYRPEIAATFDLVVMDALSPEPGAAGRFLVLLDGSVDRTVDRIPRGEVRLAPSGHPLAGLLGFDRLSVSGARRLSLPATAQSILEIDGQPVGVAQAAGASRRITLGFDLLSADFPLTVAFPLMIARSVRWLSADPQPAAAHRPGEALVWRLPPALESSEIVVETPNGQTLPVSVEDGQAVFAATDLSGVYAARGSGYARRFAVSSFDPGEADIASAPTPRVEAARAVGGKAEEERGVEMSRWLLLPALLFLLLEWAAWVGRRFARPVLQSSGPIRFGRGSP